MLTMCHTCYFETCYRIYSPESISTICQQIVEVSQERRFTMSHVYIGL
jgi:hypothetical protein